MEKSTPERREFIKKLVTGVSLAALDWDALPKGGGPAGAAFDAVIIGSGLGGLACAAAFARQGFRPVVLEEHEQPGGYATTFSRPGGFTFDVSLHSTTVGERNGVHNLIGGFPEITDVEFVPHPNLYRAIYPDHDFRVPQKDVGAYVKLLDGMFPGELEGIRGLVADMKALAGDITRLSGARGKADMNRFPVDFPHLFAWYDKTWGDMVNARIRDPRLRTIVSTLWGYYGLPPSRLSSVYYALPTIGYMENGGYYPKGRSRALSGALVAFIEGRGGKVILGSRVEEILVKDHAATGVRTADGAEYTGKVVVSNANAYDTFHTLIRERDLLKEYLDRMDRFSVSLSSFQVFLGLKEDLTRRLGITDTEIFYETGYDIEGAYADALAAKMDAGGYGLMLYDNLYKGYSPEGKNTLTVMTLQGYDHWKEYEAAYLRGDKAAYRAEKERMADMLIKKAEETLLPGLSKAIEVREVGTPLTNLRYTGNYRGAVYGWDQTVDNSGRSRLPHRTPVKNLWLAGAWTSPGHGYGGVIASGLECFGEIMGSW